MLLCEVRLLPIAIPAPSVRAFKNSDADRALHAETTARRSRAMAVIVAVAAVLCLRPGPGLAASSDNRPGRGLLTVAQMVEVADFAGISVSPDGSFAVARVDKPDVAANTMRATWYLVNLVDASVPPRMLAPGGDPRTELGAMLNDTAAVWSPDSKAIYFTALHGEELAIWKAPLEGTPTKITDDPANVERFALDPASGKIFYEVKATREAIRQAELEEYERGVLVDDSVEVSWPLQYNMPFRGRMTTFRFKPGKGVVYPLHDTQASLKVIDTVDGSTMPARQPTPQEAARYRELVQSRIDVPGLISSTFNDMTGAVAFTAWEDPARPRSSYDPAAPLRLGYATTSDPGSMIFCHDVLCTQAARQVTWRPSTEEIVFVTQAPSGASALRSWNITSNVVRTIFQLHGLIGATTVRSHKVSKPCPVTQKTAVCTVASADSPPRLVGVDLDSGQIRELLDPNRQLRQQLASTVEPLGWKDRYGREITGVLVLPAHRDERRPLPLVITSYRCEGFLRGGGGANVPEHVLAQHGMAALCVNFAAAHMNQPHPDVSIPRGQARNLQTTLDSWESAVDYLQRRGLIDAAKVGVSGHSMTGEAVQYAITHSKRFAAAGATHASITDPFSYYFYVGAQATMHDLYGLPHPERDSSGVYRKLSPALNVDAIVTPLLVQSGEMEFRQSIQYWHELLDRGKPAEFFIFPNEQHLFWQPAQRVVMNQRFIDWFRFWLQDYEDPRPERRDQYLRWRKLRERSSRSNVVSDSKLSG